jgi:hypothetical protein
MNLTGQPVYTKGQKRKPRSSPPNVEEKRHWVKVRAIGCCICRAKEPELHHCGTGRGGRKDHMKVIPLCYAHHRGKPDGLHFIGRKAWQERFGTEQEHLAHVALSLR